jgi:hypothetical protein
MATTNINEIENWLDNLDPSRVKARDAVHFRQIIAAQDGVARAALRQLTPRGLKSRCLWGP